MAAREQGNEHLAHRLLLSDDHFAQFALNVSSPPHKIGNRLGIDLAGSGQVSHASAFTGSRVGARDAARSALPPYPPRVSSAFAAPPPPARLSSAQPKTEASRQASREDQKASRGATQASWEHHKNVR